MFFFMTRKRFEFYINNRINRIVEQYETDDIKLSINKIISELNSLKMDISKAINSFSNQDRNFNEELVRVSNEINNCKEEIKKILENGYSVDKDVLTRIIQSELKKHLLNSQSVLSMESNKKQPINSLNETDIRAIVRTELQNWQYSQRIDIKREIESKNRDIDNLRNALQQESLKNSEHEKKIISQEKEIAALKDIISAMKLDIDKLTNSSTTLEKTEVSEIVASSLSIPDKSYIVFGSDMESNNKHLENIINQTKVLRKKVIALFDDSQDLNIYLKLIDKCILKMEQLLSKNQDGDLEPDKLANDCAKIYKQTIVKAMSQEKLKDLLKEYMRTCNFRKLKWDIGKKLSDDDFQYLEEPILYEKVEDKELDNTIRVIKQDTYIIEYMDEDKKYEVIIPGIYCLGKFRE